jgi:hypothetical protein
VRPLDAGARDRAPAIIDARPVDRPPNGAGILLRVKNNCAADLWIHGAGKQGVLQPDNMRLAPGESRDYVAPDTWSSARVTAFLAGPNATGRLQNEIEKVELTIVDKVINYNITYVDWLGLPVHMVAFGSGRDCKPVSCPIKQSEIATGCPDGLMEGTRCLSAGSYCARATNRAKPYCQALDAKIAECAANPTKYPGCAAAAGATTPQVFGCSGFFGGSPKWCAALNRGMLDDPDNGDIRLYYKNEPYNSYSKWVHTVCPGIYAFPYDDYGKTNESGFHSCAGGTQLDVVFCPGG